MSRPRIGSSAAVVAMAISASSGHVIYPAWLAWRTRGGRHHCVSSVRHPEGTREWPAITVVVPAFREEGIIASKVEDVRANGYEGQLSVLVVADGDPGTAKVAESCGARVLSAPDRLGKSEALNRGFAESDTPIVVISDANNQLTPGALAALVVHFDDPEVAAVAGEKLEVEDGRGEGLYWKFESWLKRREDQLGNTIGLVGELAAIRADVWRPIPADVAVDDLWTALDIIERGYRVAYEPSARALEPPVTSLALEWERRTRITAGALNVIARRRRQLRPSAGLVAAELWGHRLVRYTLSPVSHAALLAWAFAKVRSSALARAFLIANVCAGAGLVVGARTTARGSGTEADVVSSSNPIVNNLAASGHVVFLQAAALGGLVRFLRGERLAKWPTPER